MKYNDAIAYMEGLRAFEKAGKQSSLWELLKKLGDPQRDLTFIYIDRIQGRETIPAYVAMVLKCAGHKVGRYITQNVFDYREHFQIGGRNISMKRFSELVEQVKEVCDQMIMDGEMLLDASEVRAAVALLHFKEQGCQLVILSEDMGFSEDDVWVSEQMIRISVGRTPEDMPKKVKSGPEKQRFDYQKFKGLEITLAGAGQVENAVLAIEVLENLGRQGFEITEKALRKGILETVCQGRFSVIDRKPYFVADIVYNSETAEDLARSIELYFNHKRILFIMGMCRNAEVERIINKMHNYAEWIITVAAPGDNSVMSSLDLAGEVAKVHSNVTAVDSPEEATEIAHLLAGKEDVIIAFGPVSLVGKLMEIAKNRKLC